MPATSGETGKSAVPSAKGGGNAKKQDDGAGDDAKAEEDQSSDDGDEPESEDGGHGGEEQSVENLSAKQKQKLATIVARSALLQFGLKLASAKLSGSSLNVVVTRASACRADATQEPNMVEVMKAGVPGVKSVYFGVAGSSKELGYYVLDCKRPKMPNGPGQVVLEHTGVRGPYIKRFRIDTKHWALEFENQSTSLAVIVESVGGKRKGDYFAPVGSRKAEAGRKTYLGPGLFQVKAYGAGRWSIRAKELP